MSRAARCRPWGSFQSQFSGRCPRRAFPARGILRRIWGWLFDRFPSYAPAKVETIGAPNSGGRVNHRFECFPLLCVFNRVAVIADCRNAHALLPQIRHDLLRQRMQIRSAQAHMEIQRDALEARLHQSGASQVFVSLPGTQAPISICFMLYSSHHSFGQNPVTLVYREPGGWGQCQNWLNA